jgi:hypothetical protein
MSAFTVRVRRLDEPDEVYTAIGPDSSAVQLEAYDRFGACGVSVHPA